MGYASASRYAGSWASASRWTTEAGFRTIWPRSPYGSGTGCRSNSNKATIWYTDSDRGLMDVGRLAADAGYVARYPMKDAYRAFIDWMRLTPDFWR